jgi:hypothetical protein
MSHFGKSLVLATALLLAPAIIGAAEYAARPLDIAALPAPPAATDAARSVQPAHALPAATPDYVLAFGAIQPDVDAAPVTWLVGP